jgi:hypothetical protein
VAAYTSTQSGNWSDTATWGGGGYPVNGDTAAISNTHTVTITGTETVGTSPTPASDAITCSGSGTLINNGNLTVKGNITLATGPYIGGAGSTLTFEVPSGLLYGLYSNTAGAEGAYVLFNGSSGSRCTVTKNGDGSAMISTYMSGTGGTDIAAFTAYYTDFSNMGNASNRAVYTRRGSLIFEHCVFNTCYSVGNTTTYFYPESDLIFSYCRWKNSADTWDVYLHNQTTTLPTGNRKIEYCSFETGFQLVYSAELMSIVHSYVPTYSHTAQTRAADHISMWSYCFIDQDTDFNNQAPLVTYCYRYVESTDNAHFFVFTDLLYDPVYSNNILEHGSDWSLNEPDGLLNALAVTSSHTVTAINNIVLPNAAGRASCTLFTDNCSYALNLQWIVNKNTCYSDDTGGALVAAHGTGEAGRIQSYRSNLCWANAPTADACMMREVGDYTPTNDYITVANFNGYNIIDIAYDVTPAAFAATPGTNDITSVNPLFVDSTRDLAKWSQVVLGNSGTEAQLRTDAVNSLRAMNDPSDPNYNSLATIQSLVDYVRNGFIIQEALYSTAGHDGGVIGAMPYQAPSTGTATSMYLMFGI